MTKEQHNQVWEDANQLVDYWQSHGMNLKTAYKAAKASAFLLMMNDKNNEIWWHKIYNYLTKVYTINYEKKTEGDQDTTAN